MTVKKKTQELLSSPIRVAVLGAGAREHALAAKIEASPFCSKLVVLPGNDGMKRAGIETVPADLSDHEALAASLKDLDIQLVVVGPDDLLADGIVDALEASGLAVFGPRKAAARIEWSKTFAKEIMREAGVPTARYVELTEASEDKLASAAAELGGYPLVLKFDGLALGKGVRICADEREALEFARATLEGHQFAAKSAKHGKAGKSAGDSVVPKIVIEQFLTGHEVSLFALTDGSLFVTLEPACDHKRLGEGNIGPNTGGMGAYSPVPWLSHAEAHTISSRVFPPLLEKLREAKAPFRGLLYAGLMVRGNDFWVLEFNARFGDPETQALLPRLESDLLPLLYGIAVGSLERNLDAHPLRWMSEACVNIVAASRGYPEKPETGFAISGLEKGGADVGCSMYFAGVKKQGTELVTSGGRVLGVSALDQSLDQARNRAIAALESVSFEGMSYRRDIGSVY